MEFVFDQQPDYLRALDALAPGSTLSAQNFFSLLGEADEDDALEAASALTEKGITIDISSLPELSGKGEIGRRLALEKMLAEEDRLPGGLERDDTLRLYWQELSRLPRLEDGEIAALWKKEEQKGKLTEGLLYLVAEEAPALAGRGVLLLDLMQEGALGLMTALEQPAPLTTAQVRWYIGQAMLRPILLQYLLSGEAQKLMNSLRDYQQADRRLLEKLGRNPLPEELAQELGKSPEETAILSKLAAEAAKAPAAASTPEESPEEAPEAVEDSPYFQLRSRVEELLSSLEDTDRQLLTLRFGLDGKSPRSTAEAAALLGLTTEEAEKRELAAIMQLREQ